MRYRLLVAACLVMHSASGVLTSKGGDDGSVQRLMSRSNILNTSGCISCIKRSTCHCNCCGRAIHPATVAGGVTVGCGAAFMLVVRGFTSLWGPAWWLGS